MIHAGNHRFWASKRRPWQAAKHGAPMAATQPSTWAHRLRKRARQRSLRITPGQAAIITAKSAAIQVVIEPMQCTPPQQPSPGDLSRQAMSTCAPTRSSDVHPHEATAAAAVRTLADSVNQAQREADNNTAAAAAATATCELSGCDPQTDEDLDSIINRYPGQPPEMANAQTSLMTTPSRPYWPGAQDPKPTTKRAHRPEEDHSQSEEPPQKRGKPG